MGILDSFIQFNQPRTTNTRTTSTGKAAIAKSSGDGKQAPVVLQRGEVIRGEVIDLRSKEVTVRLQDGRIINAKQSDTSTLYIGQKADFYVQETTDSVILLRLVPDGDTNFAENTINKALEAAGLPKTIHTTAIVSTLLKENMPVGKDHIRQFMQLVAQNREASLSTLALLTKHNIPVTKENINQFEAFRNYEHRLTEQITTLSDTLTSFVSDAANTTDNAATGLQKQLLSMLAEPMQNVGGASSELATPNGTSGDLTLSGNLLNGQTAETFTGNSTLHADAIASASANVFGTGANISGTGMLSPALTSSNGNTELSAPLEGALNGQAAEQLSENSALLNPTNASEQSIGQTEASSAADHLTALLQKAATQNSSTETNLLHANVSNSVAVSQTMLPETESYTFSTLSAFLSKEEYTMLSRQLQTLFGDTNFSNTQTSFSQFMEQLADGTLETSQFFSAVSSFAEQFPHEATALFRDTTYQTLFSKALSRHFLLTPQDMQEEQAVTNYYERLDAELSAIRHTLEQAQQNNPAADSAKQIVSNMQDNVQFMNSLNSLFPYVQLPLKFMEQTSHGELYVYTKKRELAQNGSSISVLLHLDMNHLGPIDIHLSLTGKNVAAKFYLEEELSKQVTQSNLPSLSEALAKKGYSLSSEVLTRETKPDPVKEFMQDTQAPLMKRYTFDIRA